MSLEDHFGRTVAPTTDRLDDHFGRSRIKSMDDQPDYRERFILLQDSIAVGAFDQARVLADLLIDVEEYRERVIALCEQLPDRVNE